MLVHYAYGYPQEVRTNTGIETIEGEFQIKTMISLNIRLDSFHEILKHIQHADLDRSYTATEVCPTLMKPLVGFDYKTPSNACNAAKANPGSLLQELMF